MTLEILVPSETHGFYDVNLVDVDSVGGRMTFLPRHIDCAAELVPGLVRIRTADGEEHYAGTDGGTVVKVGDRVAISTPRAVVGRALGEIHQELERRRQERAQRAREAQTALARLEIQLAQSVLEQEPSHG